MLSTVVTMDNCKMVIDSQRSIGSREHASEVECSLRNRDAIQYLLIISDLRFSDRTFKMIAIFSALLYLTCSFRIQFLTLFSDFCCMLYSIPCVSLISSMFNSG